MLPPQRSSLKKAYEARSALKNLIRQFFDELDFIEVDTPVMVPQPGVEVHIDYFQTTWHNLRGDSRAFYLRSSPELAMKQLIKSGEGFDRVFQLGPCFRTGGEFTPWHHPEFQLLEWYQTNLPLEGMIQQTYDLITHCARHWPKSLQEASQKATTQPPNLDLTILSVTEAFKQFAAVDLIDMDPDLGAKGLAQGLQSCRKEDDFETSYFKILLEKIEPALTNMGLVCLRDFPASQAVLAEIKAGVAMRFEFYWKGVELCNAFQECMDSEENSKRLEAVNQARRTLKKPEIPRDEAFYDALKSSTHSAANPGDQDLLSGNALGFERLLALLQGQNGLGQAIGMGRRFFDD